MHSSHLFSRSLSSSNLSIHTKLNDKLNQFKIIVDQIESYATEDNIGFRSLKNLGVWLCLFALTQEKDRATILEALAEKADLSITQSKNLNDLLNALIEPKTLSKIIHDYQKINGSFTIALSHESSQLVAEFIIKSNYDFLLPFIRTDQNQKNNSLAINIDHRIRLNWIEDDRKTADIISTDLIETKNTYKFQQSLMDYLTAKSDRHDLSYGLIEHDHTLYHVARIGTWQQQDKQKPNKTYVYLIENLDMNSTAILQKNYLTLIQAIENNNECFNLKKTIAFLEKHPEIKACEIKRKYTKNLNKNRYDLHVNFPQIKEALKTTEQRAGIYQVFNNMTIAGIQIDEISLHDSREIDYNKEGGCLLNEEEFRVIPLDNPITPSETGAYTVTLTYTVANPFVMVATGPLHTDYYAMRITDPNTHLEKIFSENDDYPTQTLDELIEEENTPLEENMTVVDTHHSPDKKCCTIL